MRLCAPPPLPWGASLPHTTHTTQAPPTADLGVSKKKGGNRRECWIALATLAKTCHCCLHSSQRKVCGGPFMSALHSVFYHAHKGTRTQCRKKICCCPALASCCDTLFSMDCCHRPGCSMPGLRSPPAAVESPAVAAVLISC